MPSARDLMQKADALMRSNRNLGVSPGSGTSSMLANTMADHDVPVLTDIVIAGDATVLRHDHAPAAPMPAAAPMAATSLAATSLAATSLSAATTAPVTAAPATQPQSAAFAPSALQPTAGPVDESRRLADELARQAAQRETEKSELAESVYFEVLRDLDVDTAGGMRERISSQLMPVFESMGRELVVRVEQALSDAIRDQVAAAIERRLGGLSQKQDQGPA